MKATIKTIAQRAGVSPSTVSRVIHNNPRIGEATRDRILQIMKELNYRPNVAARTLAQGKSLTLGLIIPDTQSSLFLNSFSIMAMRGISIRSHQESYNIMYNFAQDKKEELTLIESYITGGTVDGIILMSSTYNDPSINLLRSKGFPFVLIGQPEASLKQSILWVDNDNVQASKKACLELLKYSSKIGLITGSPDQIYCRDREKGVEEAFKSLHIPLSKLCTVRVLESTEKQGKMAAKKLLESQDPIEGILAIDDNLALGALSYIKEKRGHCPIFGFNNSLKGELSHPGLSTVDIQAETLGKEAADLLITFLKTKKISHRLIETQLIKRESHLG